MDVTAQRIEEVAHVLEARLDALGPHPTPKVAPRWWATWRALVAWRRIEITHDTERFALEGWQPVFDEADTARRWQVNPVWLHNTPADDIATELINKELSLGVLR